MGNLLLVLSVLSRHSRRSRHSLAGVVVRLDGQKLVGAVVRTGNTVLTFSFPLFHPPSSSALWECRDPACSWRDFQGLVERGEILFLVFHALSSPALSTAIPSRCHCWPRARCQFVRGIPHFLSGLSRIKPPLEARFALEHTTSFRLISRRTIFGELPGIKVRYNSYAKSIGVRP